MKKNLISEVSRIYELMNVNSDKLLLEDKWCPFCDAIIKQIDELESFSKTTGVNSKTINLKINEILERVKNNTDLTINQKVALTQAAENLKKSGDEMGDVVKYAENARTAIRAKSDVLSNIPANKVVTYNYTDELYSTKEFADDFVEYGGVDVPGITKSYETEFETNGTFYQGKYATFDEWFDGDFKIQLDNLLQADGYTNKTFRDNIIENMRNRFKNNDKIKEPWSVKNVTDTEKSDIDTPVETDDTLIELDTDPAVLSRHQRYEKLKKKKDAGKNLNQQEKDFYKDYEDVYIIKIKDESKVGWDRLELLVKDLKEARKNLNSLLDTQTTLGKKYTQTLIDIINSREKRISSLEIDCAGLLDENGNLMKDVEELLNEQNGQFVNNLKDGKYKVATDKQGNWLDINMLTSNKTDRVTFFIDYASKNGYDIKSITKEQVEEILQKMSNEKDEVFDDIMLDIDRYTKTSKITSAIGDEIEVSFRNLFKDIPELNNQFEIVWFPTSKGNAIDMHLGMDLIIRDKTTKKLYGVQIKRSDEIALNQSIAHGGENLKFKLFSGIKLKKGFVGVIDKKNNFLLYPPQDLYIKEGDVYIKIENKKGFNTRAGYNFVDFGKGDQNKFYTNLKTPTVTEQIDFIFKNYLFNKYFGDII